jgi:hypothetical protein
MRVIKLAVVLCRWLAATVCSGCLLIAFHLLLHGVAQLAEGEGLAKSPETTEEVRDRLQIVFALFSTALCASLVFLASQMFPGPRGEVLRSRLRKAVFAGFVFWGAVGLFFCLLILAGSLQARWEVPPSCFWFAGGAGAVALLLLGSAGFFADGNLSEPAKPAAADDPVRHPGSP